MVEVGIEKVKNDNIKAIDYHYKLIKFHKKYAEKLGIYDIQLACHTKKDSKNSLMEEGKVVNLIKYGGVVVGLVVYSKIESVLSEDCWYINNLYIDEDYRGRGIGSEVIRRLSESTNIGLEVSCWYELEAHEFYKKLGFVPIKTIYRKV